MGITEFFEYKQINKLRNDLFKTDYQSIKTMEKLVLLLAEKFLTDDNYDFVAEFSALINQRQEWRDKVNDLENQIKLKKQTRER